jgi:hypothetical protein
MNSQEKNHPDDDVAKLRKLYPHVFDRKRAHATTKSKMEVWMNTLHTTIEENNPSQIWSIDESQLHGKGSDEKMKRRKVVGVKGKIAQVQRTIMSEHVSIMAAISAAGTVLPPFVIFTGKV